MNSITKTTTTLIAATDSRDQLPHQIDYVLLDGSSSMFYDNTKWWSSLGALDEYFSTIKAAGTDTQVLIHVFDSMDLCYEARNEKIRDFVPLLTQPIGAHGGSTPLYDAICDMGRRLRDLNPPRASVVIVTDGEENASKANLAQAKLVLDWMRGKGWQITFIGADFNNSQQAAGLGAGAGNAIGTSAANLKLATKALAEKRARYGRTGEAMHYTDEEKAAFGGYLG